MNIAKEDQSASERFPDQEVSIPAMGTDIIGTDEAAKSRTDCGPGSHFYA